LRFTLQKQGKREKSIAAHGAAPRESVMKKNKLQISVIRETQTLRATQGVDVMAKRDTNMNMPEMRDTLMKIQDQQE